MGQPQQAAPSDLAQTAADLVHNDISLPESAPASRLVELFEANPLLDGVAVETARGIGLIPRARFLGRLRGKFGYALYERRPISEHVEHDCLKVAVRTPSLEVITAAAQRPADRIYDDIIVLNGSRVVGLVSMRFLMTHSKDLLAMSISEVTALEKSNQHLKEMNQRQQEFVANLTHELRAPLNTVIAVSEHLNVKPDLPPKCIEDSRIISRRARDLLGIVNDMLDVYKLASGQMKAVPEDVDLRALLEDALASTEYLLAGKPIRLFGDFQELPPAFYTDPVFLKRILTNLLSNAAKFTEEGRITLRAIGAGAFVLLEVEDTGTGISQQDMSRIFQKFVQLESAKTKRHGGTGLGLAIVKELVELLHGEIQVESSPGRGTRFRIHLPQMSTESPSIRRIQEV